MSNLFLSSREARHGGPSGLDSSGQNQWAALRAAHEMVSEKPNSMVLVPSAGIEPASSPSEGDILSIKLRGQIYDPLSAGGGSAFGRNYEDLIHLTSKIIVRFHASGNQHTKTKSPLRTILFWVQHPHKSWLKTPSDSIMQAIL